MCKILYIVYIFKQAYVYHLRKSKKLQVKSITIAMNIKLIMAPE